MFARLRLLGILLALVPIALALPPLASFFFLNLANTQIARAVKLPADVPSRAALLADADASLARAKTFSNPSRLGIADARLALAQNDLPRALAVFDSVGPPAREDFIAQFMWGDAAWRSGQREIAFAHWRAANAREYFRQQMNRAQYAHRWQDAENFARIAIGIDVSSADAHYVLANALSAQNPNSAEAFSELDRAQALTQDKEFLSTILSLKGEILATQNQFQAALAAIEQARQYAPTDARPRTDYAVVSVKLDANAKSQSVVLLTQVIADSPWYTAAYIALADISDADGEMWLKKGLDKNPSAAPLWFALGRWYAWHQRPAEAKAALVAALQNENRADVLQQIAQAIAELPK